MVNQFYFLSKVCFFCCQLGKLRSLDCICSISLLSSCPTSETSLLSSTTIQPLSRSNSGVFSIKSMEVIIPVLIQLFRFHDFNKRSVLARYSLVSQSWCHTENLIIFHLLKLPKCKFVNLTFMRCWDINDSGVEHSIWYEDRFNFLI